MIMPQQAAHGVELQACEARLASKVRAIFFPLGVLDAGPLGGLGGFRLGYQWTNVARPSPEVTP
jgi:hypothetical protein